MSTVIGTIIILLFFGLNMIYIFLSSRVGTFRYSQSDRVFPQTLPTVSILIAARNEEDNITRCLDSLLEQDYPKEKIEIIVGDDMSDDNTFSLSNNYNRVKAVKITKQLDGLQGKANVLAQIADEASGEYLAFTDADIQLPSAWLKNMVTEVSQEGIGIVSGSTLVEKSKYQMLDWLYAFGMIKTVSDMDIPVTGVGNNMIIPHSVYKDVGGFRAVQETIVEDYALFKHIVPKYGYKHLFDEKTLALSRPARGTYELLMQRKRWMTGAVKLPWAILGILLLQASFYPLLIALIVINLKTALYLWAAKAFFQSLYVALLSIRLNLKIRFLELLFYEAYAAILSIVLMVFYLLPIRVDWKGRKYKG